MSIEVEKSERGVLHNASERQRSDARRLQEITAGLASRSDLNWQMHSHLTLGRMNLSRILYYDRLYRQIIGVPGVILEFGVEWGATLALLSNLRGVYEPYNVTRRIVGFDTFAGFPSVHENDGAAPALGDYAVPAGHQALLDEILSIHEAASPVPHVVKHELVQGDLIRTLPEWLDANPHAIVAMAIFDVDLYEPTKAALAAVIPRLTKGSVLVFDELNSKEFPGETIALQEVLGSGLLRLRQDAHQSRCSWAVWGDAD